MSSRYDFLAQLNALDMALDERKRYLASTGQLTPQEDYGISLAQQSNAARARSAGVGGPMLNEPDRPANIGVLPSGFADWGRDTARRTALAGTSISRGLNTIVNRGEQNRHYWQMRGLEEQISQALPSTPQTQESGIAKATGTIGEAGWMVPTAAAGGLIGGPYGAAAGAFVPSYLREYQNWFDEAVQGGMPRREASNWAHVAAGPSAAIEALPMGVTGAVGRMAKPAVAPLVRQLLGVGKTGLGESAEEAGQSVWGDVVHGIAHDPSRLDPRRMAANAWEGAKQAFAPGAIFGAAGLRKPTPDPLADANARAVAEKTALEAEKETERQAQEAQAQAMAPQVEAQQQQAQQEADQVQQAQEARRQAHQQNMAAAQADGQRAEFQASVLETHGKRPDRLFQMLYDQQQIPQEQVDPVDAAKLQLAMEAELESGITVKQWYDLEAKRRSEAKWREDRGPAPEVLKPGAPVRIVRALTSQDKGLVGKSGEVERVFGEDVEPYVEVRLEDGSRQIVRAIDVDFAPAEPEGLKAPEAGVVEEIPVEKPPTRPRLVTAPAPTESLPAPQPIRIDERPSPVATPPVGRLPRQAGEGSRLASLGFSGTPVAGYTPGVTPESVAEEAVKPLDVVAKKQPAPPKTNLLGPPIREVLGQEPAPETRGGPILEPGDIVTDGSRKGTVIGPGPEVQWEDGSVAKAKPDGLRLVPEEVAAPASVTVDPSQESTSASPTAELPQPAATRSRNRIITWDKYQSAREGLRDTLRRTNALPVDALGHAIVIGGYHFENGIREFAAWSEAVIKDAGEWVRPHLKEAFEKVQAKFRGDKADEVIRPVVEATSTASLAEFGPGQDLQISLGKQGVRKVRVIGVETDEAGKQRVRYWRWSNSKNELLEETRPIDSFRSSAEHARYSQPFFAVPKDQRPASAELLLGDQPMEEINPFVNSPEGSQETDPFVKVTRDKFLADPYAWMWTMERELAKRGGKIGRDLVNWVHFVKSAMERVAASRAMELEMAPLIAKLPGHARAAFRRHFNMLMGRLDIDAEIEKLRAIKARWTAQDKEPGQVRAEMDDGMRFLENAQTELEKLVGWNDAMRKQYGRQRYSPSLFLPQQLQPHEAVWRKHDDQWKDLHEKVAGKGSAGRIKNHAPHHVSRDIRRRMQETDNRQFAVLRALTAERIWREGKGTVTRQAAIEQARAELDEKGPKALRRKMGSFEEERSDAILPHWIDWTDEHLHDYFRNAARSIAEWEAFGRILPDGTVDRTPQDGMKRAIAAIRHGEDGDVGNPDAADLAKNLMMIATGIPYETDVTEKSVRKGLRVLVDFQYFFKIFGSAWFTLQNALQTPASSFMTSPVAWHRAATRAFRADSRSKALKAGAWEGADTPNSWSDLEDGDVSGLVRHVTNSTLRLFMTPQERLNNQIASLAASIDANSRLDIIRRGGWRAKTHKKWLGSQYGITEKELERGIVAGHWEIPAEHVTNVPGGWTVMDKIMQEGAIRANPRGGTSSVPTFLANKGFPSALLRPLKTFVINRMNQQMHAVKADPWTVIPKIITIDIIQGEVLALANKLLFNRERESEYEEDWKKRYFWRLLEDLMIANTFGLLSRPMYFLEVKGWLGPTLTLPADLAAGSFQMWRSVFHDDVKKDKLRITPFSSHTQRLAGEAIVVANKQVRAISEASRGYKFLFSEKRDVRRTMDNTRQAARFYQKSVSSLDERIEQERQALNAYAPGKFRVEVNRVVESLEKGDPLEIQETVSGALSEIVRFQDGTNEERLKAAISSLRGPVMNRAPLGLLTKDTTNFTTAKNKDIQAFAAWASKTEGRMSRGDTEAMLQSHAAYTGMFATMLKMFGDDIGLAAEDDVDQPKAVNQ